MTGILAGLRIVEGSAFIAAPLGGMTLAQMGADVIRFDRLQGGLDAHRWPVTASGASLFWAGLNKGKRSIAIDMSRPEGREISAHSALRRARDTLSQEARGTNAGERAWLVTHRHEPSVSRSRWYAAPRCRS